MHFLCCIHPNYQAFNKDVAKLDLTAVWFRACFTYGLKSEVPKVPNNVEQIQYFVFLTSNVITSIENPSIKRNLPPKKDYLH